MLLQRGVVSPKDRLSPRVPLVDPCERALEDKTFNRYAHYYENAKSSKEESMPLMLLCLVLLFSPSFSWGKPLAHIHIKLKAAVNVKKHQVKGEVWVDIPPGKTARLEVKNLKIKQASLQGKPWRPDISSGLIQIKVTKKTRLHLVFLTREDVPINVISPQAVVLTGNWFPVSDEPAIYDLRVSVPLKFEAVAPADEIIVSHPDQKALFHFVFPHPSPPPPLVAAPFYVLENKKNGLTVAVYLLENDPKLAKIYLQKARLFLERYSRLLGAYPYKRFAVVENIFETGYAYPSLTLLGRTVIRLPFIPDTSLRHEILHNWFGNGVFVDWQQGNWCEGLVTYLADHQHAVEKGQGPDYRHQLLVNYQSYVHAYTDIPLRSFRERAQDRALQAIGYGKGAFFFHMLRQEVGDHHFYQALRLFYRTNKFRLCTWDDLERAFEKVAQKDLSWFFHQWLDRPGLARLALYQGRILPLKGGKYVIGLEIRQKAPYYRLKVPVEISSSKESKRFLISLDGPRTHLDVTLQGKPLSAKLDPEYCLARYLSPPEYPPVLARLFGAPDLIFRVKDQESKNVYLPFLQLFRHKPLALTTQTIGPESSFKAVVYLGDLPPQLHTLFRGASNEDFFIEVEKNPSAPGNILVWVKAKDKQSLLGVVNKLVHLGRYQLVAAKGGKITQRELPHYTHGQLVRLNQETWGINLRKMHTLEEITHFVSLSRVIFVGEEHDQYSHHLAELDIIRCLYENGHKKLALGLEMFQRPFQKYLDDYIAGRIDEISFLRDTQYFKRWGFNWRLYKPILDYARAHKIPVIALNAPKEIVDKVAQRGLKALSPKEKKSLPELHFDNQAYRAFLRQVFKAHPENLPKVKKFENFYQAQLIWDETMAQTIANYLKKHADTQMVVLAGEEHIIYGYGIPSRIDKRGINSYSIILLGGERTLTPGAGDFILFPPPKKAPFFALLGVLIKEEKRGLAVKAVMPDHPAAKAGIKKGDLIIKADGQAVHNVADLKLVLYQKGPEDHLKLTILRKGKPQEIIVGPFEEKRGEKGARTKN